VCLFVIQQLQRGEEAARPLLDNRGLVIVVSQQKYDWSQAFFFCGAAALQ
jgi:hypothetical protein